MLFLNPLLPHHLYFHKTHSTSPRVLYLFCYELLSSISCTIIWYQRDRVMCQRGGGDLKGVDTRWYASEKTECRREVDTNGVPARTLSPKVGWNKCQRRCCATKEGGLWDPSSIGEENETFFRGYRNLSILIFLFPKTC